MDKIIGFLLICILNPRIAAETGPNIQTVFQNSSQITYPPLKIIILNETQINVSELEYGVNTESCREIKLLSTCIEKETCTWVRGTCTCWFAPKPPPFTLPLDFQEGMKRLRSILDAPPFPIIPPIVWTVTLIYCCVYVFFLILILIFKTLRALCHCCCSKRKTGSKPLQEMEDDEVVKENQDRVLIHYPKGNTILSKTDILKSDEYQVMLVHKSLLKRHLSKDILIQPRERTVKYLNESQPNPIPEPSQCNVNENGVPVLLLKRSIDNDSEIEESYV